MENEGDWPKVYIGEEPEKEKTITPGKSCHGFLFFKSCSRNPTCVGFTRNVPNLDEWYVTDLGVAKVAPESNEYATENLKDFWFGCFGASAYPRNFNPRAEMPWCTGLYALYKYQSKTYKIDDSASTLRTRNDGNGPRSPTPSTGSTGEGFQSVS